MFFDISAIWSWLTDRSHPLAVMLTKRQSGKDKVLVAVTTSVLKYSLFLYICFCFFCYTFSHDWQKTQCESTCSFRGSLFWSLLHKAGSVHCTWKAKRKATVSKPVKGVSGWCFDTLKIGSQSEVSSKWNVSCWTPSPLGNYMGRSSKTLFQIFRVINSTWPIPKLIWAWKSGSQILTESTDEFNFERYDFTKERSWKFSACPCLTYNLVATTHHHWNHIRKSMRRVFYPCGCDVPSSCRNAGSCYLHRSCHWQTHCNIHLCCVSISCFYIVFLYCVPILCSIMLYEEPFFFSRIMLNAQSPSDRSCIIFRRLKFSHETVE